MSPEQIKAYFADPEHNPGPAPFVDDLDWTPEMLVKYERALRERNYSEADVQAIMKHFRDVAEQQRLEKE